MNYNINIWHAGYLLCDLCEGIIWPLMRSRPTGCEALVWSFYAMLTSSPIYKSHISYVVSQKLFWQNRLLLKLGKHPNWQKNRHKIKSSRRTFKGKIWNNVRNLSHKKFLLTALSFYPHAFITLGRYFHLFRRNSASAFKMTLYKSNCAPHMGVFVKKTMYCFLQSLDLHDIRHTGSRKCV